MRSLIRRTFPMTLACLLVGLASAAHAGIDMIVKQGSTPIITFTMVQNSAGTNPHIGADTGDTVAANISKNGAAGVASNGVVAEVDAAHNPGLYKLLLSTTETGTVGLLDIHLSATNADPNDIKILVVAFDPADGTRLGLSALPNATAGANGGLPTGDASGRVIASQVQGNVTGNVNGSVGSISGITFPTNFSSLVVNGADGGVILHGGPANFGALAIDASGRVVLQPAEHTNIAGDVLNATATTFNTGGTIGSKINAAGSASDPLANAASSYSSSGTIGFLLSHNLDTNVGSRLAASAYTAPPTDYQQRGVSVTLPTSAPNNFLDAGSIANIWLNPTRSLTDKANFTLAAGEYSNIWTTPVTRTLTAFGFQPILAGYAAGQDPASLILGANASSWVGTGTIGSKINAAGAAGSDPWATTLPGAYSSGTAGQIVGQLLQRNTAAVQLPTTPPTGYGFAGLSGSDVSAVVNGLLTTVLDGSLTLKQMSVIQNAYDTGKVSNSYNSTTRTQTTIYYRADGVTPIVTSTVVYDANGRTVSKTVQYSNLP